VFEDCLLNLLHSVKTKSNQTCCKNINNKKKVKDKSKRSVLLKREARTNKPVKLVNKSHQIFFSQQQPPQPLQQLFCWFFIFKNGEKIFSAGAGWRACEEDRQSPPPIFGQRF
jgi:hypothetical protein